jgi:hypothetical protein
MRILGTSEVHLPILSKIAHTKIFQSRRMGPSRFLYYWRALHEPFRTVGRKDGKRQQWPSHTT